VKRDTAMRGRRFDAFELAETGGIITGRLDPATLSRLADRLATGDGGPGQHIDWRIEGGCDPLGRPSLTLTLDGAVSMLCQRCLSAFAVPVAQETMLLLARNESDLARLDDGEPEVVLAEVPVDPLVLVEDELLLTLPFSPRHAESQCAARGGARAGAATVPSPFGALAQLKASRASRK